MSKSFEFQELTPANQGKKGTRNPYKNGRGPVGGAIRRQLKKTKKRAFERIQQA